MTTQKLLFYAGVVAGVLIFGLVVTTLAKRPSADRNWPASLSRLAAFKEVAPNEFQLSNMRAFEYTLDGQNRRDWIETRLDLGQLREVWFFVEPFPDAPIFAHSFLSFVFEDESGGREAVSVSVEARKESGEEYSPLRGIFREYELAYVWSTEKDVTTRITIGLDHDLYAYKLNIGEAEAKQVFRHFAARTNGLRDRPRFYNTLFSNCTNELAKAVNEAYPGAIAWHRSWVATGRSAQFLHRLGFVGDKATPFRDINATAEMSALIRDASSQDEKFAHAWRASFRTQASPANAQ